MARVLINNNSQDNHLPDTWAIATAEEIFNTSLGHISGGRLLLAKDMQNKIALLLSPVYAKALSDESGNLNSNPNHCDVPITPIDMAQAVIKQIQRAATGCPWDTMLNSPQWTAEATQTVANHIGTAIHTERMLHADRNPTNISAVNYKTRFQGVI